VLCWPANCKKKKKKSRRWQNRNFFSVFTSHGRRSPTFVICPRVGTGDRTPWAGPSGPAVLAGRQNGLCPACPRLPETQDPEKDAIFLISPVLRTRTEGALHTHGSPTMMCAGVSNYLTGVSGSRKGGQRPLLPWRFYEAGRLEKGFRADDMAVSVGSRYMSFLKICGKRVRSLPIPLGPKTFQKTESFQWHKK
jgi:hypothetical protein